MQFFERRKDPRTVHTGQALVARAETWMREQGITRPARMSALFLPGAEP
jgi:hypothetical protein